MMLKTVCNCVLGGMSPCDGLKIVRLSRHAPCGLVCETVLSILEGMCSDTIPRGKTDLFNTIPIL
jgi:hypothetical protein